MMRPCNKDQEYFDAIAKADEQLVVVLVGEASETWSSLAIAELKKGHVPFSFFSWSSLKDARLSGEWIRYPVLQVWSKGELALEVSGFSQEKYRRLILDVARDRTS